MRPTIDLSASAALYTGESKCPINLDKVKGAIIVEPGHKLPASLTATKLEQLAHADGKERIFGIGVFAEYAKNGGEVQTSAVGYGGEEITGFSARKDTFTMKKFNPALHASLTKNGNREFDVYYYDDEYVLYGINDGTDTLAGFPMNCIYSDATPHPTSSAKASQTVTFSFANPKEAAECYDFNRLSFNPQKVKLGLTAVSLAKGEDGKYKVIEATGGTDVTSIYGALIAAAGTSSANAVLTGSPSAVQYDSANNVLTITATGEVRLKAPSVLYTHDIKGIEQV